MIKTAKKYVFDVYMPDEPMAGLSGFTDTISVTVESGDPGGEPGEFGDCIKQALREWYDGAKITIREPEQELSDES